jgi:hypothetical protein
MAGRPSARAATGVDRAEEPDSVEADDPGGGRTGRVGGQIGQSLGQPSSVDAERTPSVSSSPPSTLHSIRRILRACSSSWIRARRSARSTGRAASRGSWINKDNPIPLCEIVSIWKFGGTGSNFIA